MSEQLKNNGITTLDTTIDDNDTSVIVVDGSVFPSTGDFRVRIEDEIMLVTARSSNTLTVTRGAESTTPVGHTSGVQVKGVLTAAALAAYVDQNMPGSANILHSDSTVLAGNAISGAINYAAIDAYYHNQSAAANADQFRMAEVALRAGTYTVAFVGMNANFAGIIDWDISSNDGSFTSIATGQDWYAAGSAATRKTVTSLALPSGRHVLRGTVNGKNGSSSNYFIPLTKVSFIRTGA